jgi:hypothetical protein
MRPIYAYAVLAPTGVLASTTLDLDEAVEKARAVGGLYAQLAVVGDFRPVDDPKMADASTTPE